MSANRPYRHSDAGRVLLIEYDPDIAELVVEVLEDEGYTVRAAGTLDHALALVRAHNFDLMLVDGLSPNGEQAYANALRVLHAAGGTPVVLFTAHHHDPERVRAAGFADLIAKPFDLDQLVERVRALVRG